MNKILDLEKFISTNHVIPKSIQLWFEVEKKLSDRNNLKEKNKNIPPHKRLKIIEKELDEIWDKIEKLNKTVSEAALHSLSENEVCIRVDSFSSLDEKEQGFNNEQTWEACFVQYFAILKAAENIKEFNDCISCLNGDLGNSTINELVCAIELIKRYKELFKKAEDIKDSKEKLELNKKLESLNEEIGNRDFQNRILMNRLNEKDNNNLLKQPISGFTCQIDPKIAKEIFKLMKEGKKILGNQKDFLAIFSNESKKVDKPIKWNTRHGGKANKTALFSFLKLILELDEFPREFLRQANRLFVCGKENIFPDNYTYPSEKEQKSSIVTHFKKVKEIIKKNRPD